MQLTKAAYAKLKKDNKSGGKSAPATTFEAAIEDFEQARTKLDKAPSISLCDKAITVLAALKASVAPSVKLLDEMGFKELANEVAAVNDSIKKAKTAIKSQRDELLVGQRIAAAANNEEAKYEVLWVAFERHRAKLESAPSSKLFEICDSAIDELLAQATATGKSSPNLLPKYNLQAKVLNGIRRTCADLGERYTTAFTKCKQDRVELKKTAVALQTTLKAHLKNLNTLHGLATKAVADNQPLDLVKWRKMAKTSADGAIAKYDAWSDAFAPGTTIRAALDVKAAKIHKDDSAAIEPFSTAVFTEHKAIIAVADEIKKVAASISDLKPAPAARK